MDIVTELVIAPFNEIVEKATAAQQNAGEDDKSMLTESQKLIRGAERILKTVVPLCTRLHAEYGVNFINELKQHDEIAKYRLELNNLLWDFEDYMEPDGYEKGPYTDLQALCKNAGLGIGEVLKRMKIDPLAAAPQTGDDSSRRASAATATTPTLSVPSTPSIVDHARLEVVSPDQAQAQVPTTPEPHAAEENRRQTPPPLETNPWETEPLPILNTGVIAAEPRQVMRRPPVSPTSSDVVSPSSPGPDMRYVLGTSPRRLDIGVMMMEAEDRRRRALEADLAAKTGQTMEKATPPAETPYDDSPRGPGRSAPQLPAVLPSAHQGVQLRDPPITFSATILPQREQREQRDSLASSVMSRDSMQSSVSPAAAGSRGSMQSMPEDPDSITGGPTEHRPSFSRAPTIPANFPEGIHEGIEAVPREYDAGEGLIPVGTESPDWHRPAAARTASMPPRDCTLGLTSSFFQYKGFCEGAKETARGGSGVKKIKKPGFVGPQLVAKCAHCDFESDNHHLEMDQKQSESENFVCAGIGYRVRFLQKSHVATKRSDEELYGCIFCAHAQRTMEECDATIFFSPRKLFEHLARHPRPLPKVPGFTVIEEAEIPTELRNNYDLHLKRSAAPSPLDDVREEILTLPVATALKTVRKMHGMRLLHDHTPAFELAEGARIIGIEFPSKYQGEWALGWHDGAKKSVPFDVIRLESPPKNEVRMGGTSNIVAVARWRHSPKTKDGGEWLRFDKGDVISNISWQYAGHWCWSGSNSKGKWGIFPQHFIDSNTVREVTASDRASIASNEHKKFRFSISRKGGIRPPSFSGPSGGRA